MRVAEHLHLDVPRLLHVALEVDAPVTESLCAAVGAGLGGAIELGKLTHDLHADAAAAGCSFDQQRQADALCFRVQERAVLRIDRLLAAGWWRDPDATRDLASFDFVTKGFERGARRTDERDARFAYRVCEGAALTEQAVAGVHGVRTDVGDRR